MRLAPPHSHFGFDIPVILLVSFIMTLLGCAAFSEYFGGKGTIAYALLRAIQNTCCIFFYFRVYKVLAPEIFPDQMLYTKVSLLSLAAVYCANVLAWYDFGNSGAHIFLDTFNSVLTGCFVIVFPARLWFAHYDNDKLFSCKKHKTFWIFIPLIMGPWLFGQANSNATIVQVSALATGLSAVIAFVCCICFDQTCGLSDRFTYTMLIGIASSYGSITCANVFFLVQGLAGGVGAYFVSICLIGFMAGLATVMIWGLINIMPTTRPREEALVCLFTWQFIEDFLISALFLDVELDGTFALLVIVLEVRSCLRDSGMVYEFIFKYIIKGDIEAETMFMIDKYRYTIQNLFSETVAAPIIIVCVFVEWCAGTTFGTRFLTRNLSENQCLLVCAQYIIIVAIMSLTRILGLREDAYEARMQRLRKALLQHTIKEIEQETRKNIKKQEKALKNKRKKAARDSRTNSTAQSSTSAKSPGAEIVASLSLMNVEEILEFRDKKRREHKERGVEHDSDPETEGAWYLAKPKRSQTHHIAGNSVTAHSHMVHSLLQEKLQRDQEREEHESADGASTNLDIDDSESLHDFVHHMPYNIDQKGLEMMRVGTSDTPTHGLGGFQMHTANFSMKSIIVQTSSTAEESCSDDMLEDGPRRDTAPGMQKERQPYPTRATSTLEISAGFLTFNEAQDDRPGHAADKSVARYAAAAAEETPSTNPASSGTQQSGMSTAMQTAQGKASTGARAKPALVSRTGDAIPNVNRRVSFADEPIPRGAANQPLSEDASGAGNSTGVDSSAVTRGSKDRNERKDSKQGDIKSSAKSGDVAVDISNDDGVKDAEGLEETKDVRQDDPSLNESRKRTRVAASYAEQKHSPGSRSVEKRNTINYKDLRRDSTTVGLDGFHHKFSATSLSARVDSKTDADFKEERVSEADQVLLNRYSEFPSLDPGNHFGALYERHQRKHRWVFISGTLVGIAALFSWNALQVINERGQG